MENLVERERELWYNHPDKSEFETCGFMSDYGSPQVINKIL